MRCIEIKQQVVGSIPTVSINYNMRCIEMYVRLSSVVLVQDKLQHEMY